MRQDADKMIDKMKHLNMYEAAEAEVKDEECPRCLEKGSACSPILITNSKTICEHHFEELEKAEEGSVFKKFKNDPRVTKVGAFIRNTSIDELPQLINVLKGDISLIGNRPLPLYEAERLTTDAAVARFLAPAGITGLWQVTKRGKGEMSEQERLQLDITYAREHTFLMDMKILFMTIPALFQSENV